MTTNTSGERKHCDKCRGDFPPDFITEACIWCPCHKGNTTAECECELIAGMKAHTMECVFGTTPYTGIEEPQTEKCDCKCHSDGSKDQENCKCRDQKSWREEFDKLYIGSSAVRIKEFITSLIQREREAEWKRCINVLDCDHTGHTRPQTCIGYGNAQSDLMNNPPQDL